MHYTQEILSAQQIADIRKYTFETENTKSISPETLSLIYDQQWFQALVPKAFGGLELPLPEAVRLFEALAKADANIGWCVNLGAGANMFSGYLEEETARSIFNSSKTCCAGSGAVSGKAKKTTDGYILTGRWKYASGANHATHFTANAWLLDESGNAIVENGEPVFRSFIIPADQIINHKNWEAVGLCATSSNDFEAQSVFVPFNHTFTLLKPSSFAQGAVYKFPFSTMAVVNMTCMMTGIALHFLDEYEQLAAKKKPLHSAVLLKDNPVAKAIVRKISGEFMMARNLMYLQLHEVWKQYEDGSEADQDALDNLKRVANQAARLSRKLINDLFPLCGMNAVSPQSELNKIWRDAAVAGQHYLMSPLQLTELENV
jgi:alkylation response protein AidB-like acyl-CoA dehydrogenase